MSGEPNRAQRRAWPKRRQWCDRVTKDRRLTCGCKAWLALLASRSDDAGKPVWGRQIRQADDIGRSDRSVRSYRLEAEQLGYIKTYRAKPQRGRDGRWSRRRTNRYYLTVPGRDTAIQPAPRRRQRAPYCVVPPNRRLRRLLPEDDRRSNPLRVSPTALSPPGEYEREAVPHAQSTPDPLVARRFMAEMRATLAQKADRTGASTRLIPHQRQHLHQSVGIQS